MNKTVHIIGAGLSGLVAATELLKKGFHVTLIDQEPKRLEDRLTGRLEAYS